MSRSLLDIALRLAGYGFSIFPLDHPDHPASQDTTRIGKTPVCSWKEWQSTHPGPENLKAWFGNGIPRNVAVVTGAVSGIAVVDGDSPEALAWMGSHLPPTPMMVATAKGQHWYYRHPSGSIPNKVRVRTERGVLEVDIRGDGGYVVAPGSLHVTGHRYRAVGRWPTGTEGVPYFDPRWFPAPAETAEASEPDGSSGTIQEGARHDTLARLAGRLRRDGLGAPAIRAALLEHNRDQCRPPLEASEVERISLDIGAKPTVLQPASLVLTPLAALLAEPEEPIRWLVADRIPTGSIMLLAGKPKAGKSTLARALALAVAQGEPWLGHACERGAVWYLAVEEKRTEVRRHFQQMGGTPEGLSIFTGTAPQDVITQLHQLAARCKPALIVLDTMARCLQIRDLNDYAETTRKFEPVLSLARDTGAALLLVHHAGKGRQGEPLSLDAVLGSTALAGSADNVMMLARSERFRTLKTGQRIGPDMEETVVTLDPATGRVNLGATRQEAERLEMVGAVLDALDQAPQELTEADILTHVEGRTGAIKAALRFAFRDKKITRKGNGRRGDPYRYGPVSGSQVPA